MGHPLCRPGTSAGLGRAPGAAQGQSAQPPGPSGAGRGMAGVLGHCCMTLDISSSPTCSTPNLCLGLYQSKVSILGFWDCCWPNVMSSCLISMSIYYHRHPFNHGPGTKQVRAHKSKDKADKAGSSEQLMCVERGTEEHLPKCELPSVCLSHLEGNNAQVYKIQIIEHSLSCPKMC